MPIYDPGGTVPPPPKKKKFVPYTPPGQADPGHHPYDPNGTGPGDSTTPIPPPPVQAPAPPAPPPKIDWNAYLAADPGFAASRAGLQAQEANLLTQYGAVPTGVTQIGGGAVGGDIANAATNNPNSTLALLARQLTGNVENAQNSANSHGVLFSGVNLQNQRNEYTADQQRKFGALQTLQQALLGLGQQDAQALAAARQNWFNYYNSGVPSG